MPWINAGWDRSPAIPAKSPTAFVLAVLSGLRVGGRGPDAGGLPMSARNVADVLLLELIFEAANTLFHLLQLLQAEDHRPTGQHRI